MAYLAITPVGAILIIIALKINWVEGFNIKWRKINFIIHVFFLITILVCPIIVYYIKWVRN